MKQSEDVSTIEMSLEFPLSTKANPLTEQEIRDQLAKIISGKDKKKAKAASLALRKRMRYKQS